MKIALLNDSHFGVRNDSPAFMEYQNRFYDELFFPYLKENNIKSLVHLGDVVDRRKFINFNTAHNFQQKFWRRLWDMKIDTHIILGNHDTYYKNTNEVNAMQQLITTFDGKSEPWIYSSPKEMIFDGLKILLVPWICDDNYEESVNMIQNSTAQICMGHLEVKGFEMHKGFFNDHGLEKNLFKRFEKVISGHFHKKSDDGQIYYCGTQYEMTWNDYKCPKGFHVFDTQTRELTRVPNPLRMFRKIYYDDKQKDYSKEDVSKYDNTHIKIFVTNKSDNNMFESFVNKLHTEINSHELTIIDEDTSDITASVREDILDQGEDTLTFLGNYVEQIDTDLDRAKLKQFINNLYKEVNQ
jgi:predicted phosphodiesterase